MSTITSNLDFIKDLLQQGQIAAIPTETVYGLAANALDEAAILKIYHLKNRPTNHPLIMHVGVDWNLLNWVKEIPQYAHRLIEKFWPGPLTLVLNKRDGVIADQVTGGQSTIAIRCPNHPLTQSLLEQLQFPLVAPSANAFGKISPTTAKHVQSSFQNTNLCILDGGRCTVGIESTIVDATDPMHYQILREGVISAQSIEQLLPNQRRYKSSSIRVSGNLKTHYQPQKPLYYFIDTASIRKYCLNNLNGYLLSFEKLTIPCTANYILPKNPEQLAYELYYQLREADDSLAEFIAFELPPDNADWAGVRERLLKAGYLK